MQDHDGYDPDNPDTWGSWLHTADNLLGQSVYEQYVSALYWALSTVTTVGYGDITPVSAAGKITSMVAMVLGVTLFSYFTGAIATLVSRIHVENAKVSAQIQGIEDFLRARKIHGSLAVRIHAFYTYALSHTVLDEEAEVINGLSPALRSEVVLLTYEKIFRGHPLFARAEKELIVQLVSSLTLAHYAPGDILIRQGKVDTVLYIVAHGSLQVRWYKDVSAIAKVATILDPRAGIGELTNTRTHAPSHGHASGHHGPADDQASGNYKGILGFIRRMCNEPAPVLRAINARMSCLELPAEYVVLETIGSNEFCGDYGCLTGNPRLATVVAAEYSEVYRLERADLEHALANWHSVQVMTQELAACMHGWRDEPMPPFEHLAAQRTADKPLPQHPAYAEFTAVMRRVCAEFDAVVSPAMRCAAAPASRVTLLEALRAPAAPPLAPAARAGMQIDQAQAVRSAWARASSEVLTDCDTPLGSLYMPPGKHGVDCGAGMAAVPSLTSHRGTTLVDAGVRRSMDMPIASPGKARAWLPGSAGAFPTSAQSTELHPVGSGAAEQNGPGCGAATTACTAGVWEGGTIGDDIQGEANAAGLPHSCGPHRPGQVQHGSTGEPDAGPCGIPTEAFGQQGAERWHSEQSARFSRHGPRHGSDTTEPLAAAVGRETSGAGVNDAADVAGSVPPDDIGDKGTADGMMQLSSGSQYPRTLTEPALLSMRIALAPPIAHTQSGGLALSRRRLIGGRTEHVSLAHRALQQD
eukprot:jgi/Ulvmu1/3079/UM015_0119.1